MQHCYRVDDMKDRYFVKNMQQHRYLFLPEESNCNAVEEDGDKYFSIFMTNIYSFLRKAIATQ